MNILFAAILSLSFVSVSALAYVPPVSFILSEASKSHETVKTLVMEGKITDLRSNTAIREVLRLDFTTGRLSAAYFTENEPEGVYDSTVKDIHRLGKFWITLGMDPSQARFKQALQELNALPSNEKTEAKLWRIGNNVTWLWGEDPAVQFFKDDFLPAAYATGGVGPTGQEIAVAEYTSSASSVRVPKTVSIKFQGKEIYRYEVKSVKLNQTLKFNQAASPLKSVIAKDWVTLVR
jgi:hypothetical protein